MAVAAAPRVGLPPRALGATPAPGPVRLAAVTALGLWCSLSWARQVAPPAGGAAVGWTALAAAYGVVLLAAARMSRRRRIAVAVGTLPAALLVLLAICGVPGTLLRPDHWDSLVGGIAQGLTALPDLRVPYRGADEWVRVVILAGGGLLGLAATALACWPGRGTPVGAAVLLGTAYVTSIAVDRPERPYASGALLTVLLAALLWGDRVALPQLPLAAGLIAAAVVTGLLAAPRLDASRPWIDARHLTDGLSARSAVRFDWSHRYTPLDWPRDGREALRVTASGAAYLKGVVLERFDGVRWQEVPHAAPAAVDTEMTGGHPEWRREVTVVARDISSRRLYAPGDVVTLEGLGRPTVPAAGGTQVVAPGERALKPGDSYRASVYVPEPSAAELRVAGTDYPSWLRGQTTVQLPRAIGGPELPNIGGSPDRATAIAQVPFWGTGETVIGLYTQGAPGFYTTGRSALLRSELGPVLRLARRLGAGAGTPYDVVRRVLRRVRTGARYTETPPRARLPLVDFLFGAKEGYCQQFSGAMALLLRLNGIPARVAEGFAPGLFDRARGQHVVRDLDAHSWVEVYFPRLGWVAFDPTPSGAPPASQASDRAPSAAAGDGADRGGDRPAERSRPLAPESGGGHGRLWLGLGVLGACLLAAGLVVRGRRGGPADPAPELAELRRALTRTGRAPAATMTLAAVEASLSGDRDAQAYVRALRLRRFGPGGPSPTTAQRAALRRALAAGLGPVARVRAWLALPPRLRRGRRGPSYTG